MNLLLPHIPQSAQLVGLSDITMLLWCFAALLVLMGEAGRG